MAALLALAAMFFAQAALALGACSADEGAYRAAMERAQAASAETPPCEDHSQPAGEALHAAHCQASDQTLDKHQVNVPVRVLQPLLVAQPRVLPTAPRLAPAQRIALFPGGAPPPRILFQSFLIGAQRSRRRLRPARARLRARCS